MAALWIPVLSLLQLIHYSVTFRLHPGGQMQLDGRSASSFLSRSLLYNSWDFELVVADSLERECMEEMCSYEEAREVFEDDANTLRHPAVVMMDWSEVLLQANDCWKRVESPPRVDVSGLVAGIMALLVSAVIATVVGIYCYKAKQKGRQRSAQVPVRMAADGRPAPETVPLSAIIAPGLPSYNEALHHSGQHDAPPPPYSGGAPSVIAEPVENN